MAEAIEPGNGGGVVRPHRFFDGDSTGSAALSDGSSAAAASVRHGEGGVQGSGMTLEELMEDDGRRHAPGRALAAQISLRREERLLKPGDFPPLVAAQGNMQMLDADATVRPRCCLCCWMNPGCVLGVLAHPACTLAPSSTALQSQHNPEDSTLRAGDGISIELGKMSHAGSCITLLSRHTGAHRRAGSHAAGAMSCRACTQTPRS